jgi:hypothetical protein
MTYNTTRRKPLRGAARQAFLDAHGCRCYWCGEPIHPDQPWDDEHELARELGGSDEMSNRKPIHRLPCHKIKTAIDRKLIAKSNRIRRRHGLDPDTRKHKPRPIRSAPFRHGPKQRIPSRPFPKR